MAGSNNPLSAILEQLPAPFRNKYFVVLFFFFGWMIFFDRHDLLTQWRLQRSVDKLQEDIDYYNIKIEEAQQERYDLDINKEKFARERYYMKKRNEDVFIIVEE